MTHHTRRGFFADVGRGMLLASVGSAVATDLGLAPAWAEEAAGSLTFGKLEPLVALMEETSIDKLQPLLVDRLQSGKSDLATLVAAASLANARKFGGEDYVGFHTLMALAPAYQMTKDLPTERKPLPVLKVLFRNTDHIQKNGGRKGEVLRPVDPAKLPSGRVGGELLRAATRGADMKKAEQIFAALAKGKPIDAYNHLQFIVQDNADVHRVVLAHRAWSLLDLVGAEQAHTMLRESVRYCVKSEQQRIKSKRPVPGIRSLLPKLLEENRLLDKPLGKHKADDDWLAKMVHTIYNSSKAQAAEAVAEALAEGFSPEVIGEAISLAANELELRDRNARVHGASSGVHGSDSANAWRNIARVSNPRNTAASMIVGAYHISNAGKLNKAPYPLADHLAAIETKDPKALLREAEAAIRSNDQGRATAAIHTYGKLGHAAKPVFDLMLRYALSEDGRLHGEKYYVTVREEFATTRPAFRWNHLVGLARATASGFGYSVTDKPGVRAPGYEEACRLLKVKG
ncbi:MAG: hypothetical protein IID44_11910 [Planctomycetes bacterium]|nr:hypothetical protein [Planctomycetota bacterium]